MRRSAHSAVAVGLLVPLHGFVNGAVDEAIETFAVFFRMGLEGVLAPLRHDKIHTVIVFLHIFVDRFLLRFAGW